jgi:hypothetical protein
MKTSSFLRFALVIAALKFSLLSGRTAPAATNNVAAAATNVVAKSVFTMPESKKEGCDPFFPNSTRIWGLSMVAQPTTAKESKPSGVECLTLKGLSGTFAKPLAMINGYTMEKGEEAEVTTDCGRLLVHCVDITTNAAVIEVSGERRELHLRSDF